MSRPIGVTLIAVLLIGVSLLMLSRAVAQPGGHKHRSFLFAAILLTFLAALAAEALWSLRPHAFVAFMVWGLCAIATVALHGLNTTAGAHPVRILPPLVYAGLGFAGVAIYLRRAL